MNYNDPEHNWNLLLKTREYLEQGKQITREWYEFHRNLILQYAEVIPKCMIHAEMDDPAYNEVADTVELTVQHLKDMIEVTNVFPPRMYFNLVCNMIDMIERSREMTELNKLMECL